MRKTFASNKFRKEYKLCLRRGWHVDKLQEIVVLLENDEELPTSCRSHKLSGNFSGMWECHIAPNWLLIYEIIDDHSLKLERTGTHADLFR